MRRTPLKVLFTIAGLHPESGGPSHSVPHLCAALVRSGVTVEIVSQHYGPALGEPILSADVMTTFVRCDSAIERRLQWTPRFKRALFERCRVFEPHLIHDTGLWLSTNRASAQVGERLHLPRVVSPRGMLSGWALQHKAVKKRIAWLWYQRRDLQRARLLHATAAAEAANIRDAALRQPIALIPNGVDLPPECPPAIRDPKRKTLLYLGRVHPVKGLANLIEAWARVRPGGWNVVIAGGDENNHSAELQKLARAKNVAMDFEFIGAVHGDARWAVHRLADLFVLPSHSENFGMVVAEALACGVPVVASRATPWHDLESHDCGWWRDNDPDSLAEALREATACSDERRQAMGARGRQLVQSKYSWASAATQMKAAYEWIIGWNRKPEDIIE